MRTQILDHFCDQLERYAPPILEQCDPQTLLHRARRIYSAGGSPLPDTIRDKAELIDRIVHAAQIFLMHAIEQRLLWMGNFEEEKKRIQAATEQEYEGWIARFETWASETARE